MRGVLKMAHVDHYKKTERRAIVKEAVRDLKEYKNYVDPDRTHLNYALVNTYANVRGVGAIVYENVTPDLVRSVDRALKERVEEYQQETGCQVRKNSVVLSSWVVQCPEALRGNVENEKMFFDQVNTFMIKELGNKNVIATFVHYDETTPHCHVHTVPCGHNRNTGKPAIGSNAVYTREYLKDFHVRFNDHMEAVFGIKNLIVTEERVTSQKGNLSLTEFKKAKLKEEVAEMTKEIENIEIYKKKVVSEVLDLQTIQRDLTFNISRLRAHNDELEARNDELKNKNKELTNENNKLTVQKDWLVKESEGRKELNEEWKKETSELVKQHAELSANNKILTNENDKLTNENEELRIRNTVLNNAVKKLEESKQSYERIVKEAHEQYKDVTRKITDLLQRLFRYEKQANDISKKRAYRNLRSEIEKDEDMDLEL